MMAATFTPRVSAHALVRWLERVRRIDIEAVRARMVAAGIVQPLTGGIVDFLQSAGEIDVAELEAEILTPTARIGIERGACGATARIRAAQKGGA